MNLPPPRERHRAEPGRWLARLRRAAPWSGRSLVVFAALLGAWRFERYESFAEPALRQPLGTASFYLLYSLADVEYKLRDGVPYVLWIAALLGALLVAIRFARNVTAGTANDPLIRLRNVLRRRRWLAPALLLSPFLYIFPRAWIDYRTAVAERASELQELAGSVQRIAGLTGRRGEFARESYIENFAYANELPDGVLAAAAQTLLLALVAYAFGKLLVFALDRLPDREAVAASTEGRAPLAAALADDEITFRAVAVTPRARAIVVGVAALTILAVAGLANLSMRAIVHMEWLGPAVAAYAASLFAAQYWFRRASTIGIGADGVLVRGTSKTHFYAYRDFDEVRVAVPELIVVRANRALVRLQLHGEDRGRGELLAERIRRALHLSKSTSSAEMIVAGHGALAVADYRAPSLTREQLWELVEGDGTASDARTAAAQSLARGLGTDERNRLRVAGSRCADPRVRVAIEALVTTSDDAATADDERQARA